MNANRMLVVCAQSMASLTHIHRSGLCTVLRVPSSWFFPCARSFFVCAAGSSLWVSVSRASPPYIHSHSVTHIATDDDFDFVNGPKTKLLECRVRSRIHIRLESKEKVQKSSVGTVSLELNIFEYCERRPAINLTFSAFTSGNTGIYEQIQRLVATFCIENCWKSEVPESENSENKLLFLLRKGPLRTPVSIFK